MFYLIQMKKLLLILSLGTFATLLPAREPVPLVVKSAFEMMHPATSVLLWEYREEAWVATFRDRRGLTKVFLQADGKWLETRIRTSIHSMPGAVLEFIRGSYGQADITYAGRVIRPGMDAVYRVESELPGEILIKEISSDGWLRKEHRIALSANLSPLLYEKVQ